MKKKEDETMETKQLEWKIQEQKLIKTVVVVVEGGGGRRRGRSGGDDDEEILDERKSMFDFLHKETEEEKSMFTRLHNEIEQETKLHYVCKILKPFYDLVLVEKQHRDA